MTKLELFDKMMEKAKANGYEGPDYEFQVGHIMDGTNIYSLLFREDFARAIWGKYGVGDQAMPYDVVMTRELAIATDKWKFLENNLKLD